jgi:hypothetical protein
VTAPATFDAHLGKASLSVKEDEGDFLVTLTIDEKWLQDKERVFPVVLDPTIYVQPDTADGEYDRSCDASAGGERSGRAPERLPRVVLPDRLQLRAYGRCRASPALEWLVAYHALGVGHD